MLYDVLRDLALMATLVGLGVGVFQLYRQANQARTSFEDSLAGEYRKLLSEFPAAALLGEHPPEPPELWPDELVVAFIRYIDLCNEQVFLRERDRIADATWRDWHEGIRDQFQRPYFEMAWRYVCRAANAGHSPQDGKGNYARLASLIAPGEDGSPAAGSNIRPREG